MLCFRGPRPSRSRWRPKGRRRATLHPSGPKRSGGCRRATFLSREEWAKPRGRKLNAGIAASRSRRSRCPAKVRPSLTGMDAFLGIRMVQEELVNSHLHGSSTMMANSDGSLERKNVYLIVGAGRCKEHGCPLQSMEASCGIQQQALALGTSDIGQALRRFRAPAPAEFRRGRRTGSGMWAASYGRGWSDGGRSAATMAACGVARRTQAVMPITVAPRIAKARWRISEETLRPAMPDITE